MPHRNILMMQILKKLHAFFYLIPVSGIQIAGSIVEAGDLVAGLAVEIDDAVRNAQRGHCLVGGLLLRPVDEKPGPRPRNAADIVGAVHRK